ncbi:MAG: hypothetical protein II761_04340, partial [Bacteroidales bacterium]|nr:hypothetical protein [Bacteroidales bacterium]
HFSAGKPEQENLLRKCADNGLIATGGSDFHGLYNSVPTHIGSRFTDDENMRKLLSLINENKQKAKKHAAAE